MYMKQTAKGEQVVANIIKKGDNDDNSLLVWMASALTKNFNADKVASWNIRIKNGAIVFFKYKGKETIPYGTGYKFSAEWVRNSST